MELTGRRVLITGASRGIGAGLASSFAAVGARVVLAARSERPIKELASSLEGSAHAIDLSDADALAGFVARVEAADGPIDVLVNNAGIDASGFYGDLAAAELEALVRTNLLAPAELIRQVLPGMIDRGRGQIVNVTSMAGVAAFPGLAPYAATKAALTRLSAGLRLDLAGLPVGVTAVEIGPVATDMLANIDGYRPTAASFQRMFTIRLLRRLSVEEVGAAVVAGVQRDKAFVRLPRRAAAFPALAGLPQTVTRYLLAGVRPRPAGR
jgi:short-subunit dehydrogenase